MFAQRVHFLTLTNRGLSCGIYATNDAEACQLIAVDCRAQVAVVEDQKQLDKILLVRICFFSYSLLCEEYVQVLTCV